MAIRVSGSYRRYLVAGAYPKPDDDKLYERLREHRFRSIDDQPILTPSIGWVVARSFSATNFNPENTFLGPHLLLRLRIDQKKLPSNAVRVRVAEAAGKMGATKIARSALAKLKADVEKELLERIVPATAVVDVLWRPQSELVLVRTTSNTVNEAFVRLFRDTFGKTPIAATPTPLGARVAAPGVDADRLRRLSPVLSVRSDDGEA
jgi:DNA recombination-dependent growth factor C